MSKVETDTISTGNCVRLHLVQIWTQYRPLFFFKMLGQSWNLLTIFCVQSTRLLHTRSCSAKTWTDRFQNFIATKSRLCSQIVRKVDLSKKFFLADYNTNDANRHIISILERNHISFSKLKLVEKMWRIHSCFHSILYGFETDDGW